MTLSEILSILGPEFSLNPLRDRLLEGVLRPEGLTPELDRLVAAMLAENPALFGHLKSLSENHQLGDELIRGVLEFMARAGDTKAKIQVADLATLLGIEPPALPKPGIQVETLTASQRAVLREVSALSEIYFDGGIERAGANLRIAPLIIGPSGVGKTHVVTAVGRSLNVPVIRMTVSNWIIQAGRQAPCALEILQRNLERHERMILFIDELDKLARTQTCEYSRCHQVEIFSALDRSLSYPGAPGTPWTSAHDEKLRRNVMIVGGGTWHDLWITCPRRPMGFTSQADTGDDIAARIRQARIIPEELLNRFSSRWLFLRPYKPEDFRGIAQRLGLAVEHFDPVAAAASGANFRAIENALTARALKQHFAQKAGPLPPVDDPRPA
jgi:hypothetical protein